MEIISIERFARGSWALCIPCSCRSQCPCSSVLLSVCLSVFVSVCLSLRHIKGDKACRGNWTLETHAATHNHITLDSLPVKSRLQSAVGICRESAVCTGVDSYGALGLVSPSPSRLNNFILVHFGVNF